MKYALLSDIHGNLEALQAVLRDIESNQVEKIHCLGDVIGYGADPVACLDLVQQHCEVKLMGNHEFAAIGLSSTEHYNEAAQVATEWTRKQLTDHELDIINGFEIKHTIADVLLVHSSPYDPERWHYILTPASAAQAFANFDERICFFGHSHLPQIYMEQEDGLPRCLVGHDFMPDDEGRYLINVGSVGQPRDEDPRACYTIFDTEEGEVTYHRVEYDIERTQSKMAQASMPQMLISRLKLGR